MNRVTILKQRYRNPHVRLRFKRSHRSLYSRFYTQLSPKVTELLDIVKTMDEIELSIFYQELRKIHQFSLLPGYTLSAPFSPKLEIPDKVLPFKVEYKLHTPEQKPGEKQQQRSDPKKKK